MFQTRKNKYSTGDPAQQIAAFWAQTFKHRYVKTNTPVPYDDGGFSSHLGVTRGGPCGCCAGMRRGRGFRGGSTIAACLGGPTCRGPSAEINAHVLVPQVRCLPTVKSVIINSSSFFLFFLFLVGAFLTSPTITVTWFFLYNRLEATNVNILFSLFN